MKTTNAFACTLLLSATTVLGVSTTGTPAEAGGFAIREQSSSFLGMAFAGAAAGNDLSSGYWNPAAFGTAAPGITTESHYAAIFAKTELSGTVVNTGGNALLDPVANSLNGLPNSTEIDPPAVLAASYGAHRINEKLVLGVSLNSPFGLSTEPDDFYSGSNHGQSSALLTFNATPTLSYEVTRGVHVAAGVQLQYADLAFKFAGFQPGTGASTGNAEIDVTDEIGVGFTAGILVQPARGTSIGVGFRSMIKHNFEGELGIPGRAAVPVTADFETPEILTVSLSQAINQSLRVHATYEWTNWSRFDSITVGGSSSADVAGLIAGSPNDLTLEGPWEDGHFFAGGAEYDLNRQLTLRGGVAWERSPIQSAEARLLQVPDSDRIWLSAGATYQFSEMTQIDIGYTHIFFDDAVIDRASVSTSPLHFQGSVENWADIIAVSLKTKWGENGLQEFSGGLLGGGQ